MQIFSCSAPLLLVNLSSSRVWDWWQLSTGPVSILYFLHDEPVDLAGKNIWENFTDSCHQSEAAGLLDEEAKVLDQDHVDGVWPSYAEAGQCKA